MTQDDVVEVGQVEKRCFSNPWPLSAYRRELKLPDQNAYIVLRDDPDLEPDETDRHTFVNDGVSLSPRPQPRRPRRFAFWPRGHRPDHHVAPPIIGFAGMWNMFDEAHITTIGISPEYRSRGLGELLFLSMVDEAIRREANWITLEVRVSNTNAQELYRKYRFTVQGRRPRYYSDNNEDAYIMWSPSLRDQDYRQYLEQLRRRLSHRLSFEREPTSR